MCEKYDAQYLIRSSISLNRWSQSFFMSEWNLLQSIQFLTRRNNKIRAGDMGDINNKFSINGVFNVHNIIDDFCAYEKRKKEVRFTLYKYNR